MIPLGRPNNEPPKTFKGLGSCQLVRPNAFSPKTVEKGWELSRQLSPHKYAVLDTVAKQVFTAFFAAPRKCEMCYSNTFRDPHVPRKTAVKTCYERSFT